MAPSAKQTPDVDPIYLLTQLVKLEEQTKSIAQIVNDLKETNEGTLRTKGMKEKIAQAQQDIEANKESFTKLENTLKEVNLSWTATIQEAFTETKVEFTKMTGEINKRIDGLASASETQKGWMTKWQPYLNVIAWAVVIVGAFLLQQFLTGHLKLVP